MFKDLFSRLFSRHTEPVSLIPETISSVSGFTIEVERKEGCILRSRPKDAADDVPYTDIGFDWHLEVTVKYDGTNPKYPNDEPRHWKQLLANARLKSMGKGIVGGVNYCRPDERFDLIEVVEEIELYQNCDMIFGGRRPFPEHVVWIRVHTCEKNGRRSYTGQGIMTRPLGRTWIIN